MSTEAYSHAFNFLSAVQGGVDPRTGLFLLNLPLGQLSANNTLGPTLPLVLNYSPLSDRDAFGLGMGVSLNLSSYDRGRRHLTLRSGEQYRTLEFEGKVNLRQCKSRTVTVDKVSGGYRLVDKAGQTEHLSLHGDNVYVPDRITSPLGHALMLDWQIDGSYQKLLHIRDGDTVLCRVDYHPGYVSITFWPESRTESYTLRLDFMNGYLTQLSNGSVAPALVWKLEYEDVGMQGRHGALKTLTKLGAPTGMTEQVTYQRDAMKYATRAGMPATAPAVLRCVSSPGHGQPVQTTVYRYSDHNYLGYRASFGNVGEDDDPLYGIETDYRYATTETLLDANGHDAQITERAYNHYHLLIGETVTRGGCSRRQETTYYAQVGKTFGEQPAQFQLPRKQTVTWRDAAGQTRQEETTCEFDADGNLLKQTDPDGTVMEWTYYPAAGEKVDGEVLCPAEPNGFVRFLKSQTHTPPKTVFDAPVRQVSYTYRSHPTLAGSLRPYAVLQDRVTSSSDGQPLGSVTTGYVNTPASSEHGRMQTRTITQHDESGHAYTSRQDFAFSVRDHVLAQTVTLTTFDQLTVTTHREQSCHSGLVLSDTDAQGNVTRYRYDPLGRLRVETRHPGTEYESTQTYTYDMTPIPSVTVQDAWGNRQRSRYDGLGRLMDVAIQERDEEDKGDE